MTGPEIAGVVGVVVAGLTAVFLIGALLSLSRLEKSVKSLQRDVQQLRAADEHAARDLDKVDALLEKADRISTRVESTSRLVAAPVIKAFAVGAGTRTAARRLRQRDGNGE